MNAFSAMVGNINSAISDYFVIIGVFFVVLFVVT